MKRLAFTIVAAVLLWRAAEACGPWFVLRAGLSPKFWQPFAKTIPDLLGKPVRSARRPEYAGMAPGGRAPVAAARKSYQAVARWRVDHFEPWQAQETPLLEDSVAAARAAIDAALAGHPSPIEADELRLMSCKITLREGESLLVMSRTKFVTPATAPKDALRKTREALLAYLAEAKTPALQSEARGWLARCHYLLGEPHLAARLYLDELARPDSALDRATLLSSLRIVFPYNGSAAQLAEHLDEYFDTPQHALFVINLVTNPVVDDDDERRAMGTVGRKALEALERHRDLFSQGAASDGLALAGMRASLYVGDPKAAIRIEDSLPAHSVARTEPEGRWMAAVAHFLGGEYGKAEPHLRAVADSPKSPPRPRRLARLGLLAVYQKIGRPVDQLLEAFRYDASERGHDWETPEPGSEWYVAEWPYVGWLMDLSYLLDIQLTEENLAAARAILEAARPMSSPRWTSSGDRKLTGTYIIDYELAVRAARRQDYSGAGAVYERLGVRDRAQRMRQLAALARLAQADVPLDEHLRHRFEYAAFLADHPERVFFNDLVWEKLQRHAFLDADRKSPPALLDAEEKRALVENERRFKDAQEERWQAFQVLDEVAEQAGHSALGNRAALKALECLERINTERFGREGDIEVAKKRLVSWLRRK